MAPVILPVRRHDTGPQVQYVTDLECPLCRLGPLGFYLVGGRVIIRCVECTSYWSPAGPVNYDNQIDFTDKEKSVMRPATAEEIKAVGYAGMVDATWTHDTGFQPAQIQ